MKLLFAMTLAFAMGTSAAYAGGSHAGGHGHDSMTVGKPGNAASVDKTVEVVMRETDGGDMIFEPAALSFQKGQTIRFIIRNDGELAHEFVLDDHERVMEHKALMEKFPEMEHDDPNAVRLAPGEKGEIIWTFSNDGSFEFACLIPGHYDSGMKGELHVMKH